MQILNPMIFFQVAKLRGTSPHTPSAFVLSHSVQHRGGEQEKTELEAIKRGTSGRLYRDCHLLSEIENVISKREETLKEYEEPFLPFVRTSLSLVCLQHY